MRYRRSVAPEVGYQRCGCVRRRYRRANMAARYRLSATTRLWEWAIREGAQLPIEADPGKDVGLPEIRARVPERRHRRQRICWSDVGHQQCETESDAADCRGWVYHLRLVWILAYYQKCQIIFRRLLFAITADKVDRILLFSRREKKGYRRSRGKGGGEEKRARISLISRVTSVLLSYVKRVLTRGQTAR